MPSLYDQMTAGRPELTGLPLIAILEPDGHQAVVPVAVGILDDEPTRGIVMDMFSDLLTARRISKARGRPEARVEHGLVDGGKFARCKCGNAWGHFPGGFGCPDADR